jgi:hypothetical protein
MSAAQYAPLEADGACNTSAYVLTYAGHIVCPCCGPHGVLVTPCSGRPFPTFAMKFAAGGHGFYASTGHAGSCRYWQQHHSCCVAIARRLGSINATAMLIEQFDMRPEQCNMCPAASVALVISARAGLPSTIPFVRLASCSASHCVAFAGMCATRRSIHVHALGQAYCRQCRVMLQISERSWLPVTSIHTRRCTWFSTQAPVGLAIDMQRLALALL